MNLIFGLLCQCNSVADQHSNKSQTIIKSTQDKSKSIIENHNSQDSDFPSINIKPGQVLESPIKIAVNSEGKWGGFEGELGTIELFDKKDNSIGLCILSTTENWMVNGPVNYYCDLIYHAGSVGKGRIVVKNNNPTGDIKYDKSFVIPVQYVGN